jgi:hypothetical protein
VLVDGTLGKITATGQGHTALSLTAQQCAHEIIAGTHFLDQSHVRLFIIDLGAVDFHNTGLGIGDFGTHAPQNFKQNADIGDVRHIFNTGNATDQQGCRDDGDGGVFRAADGDLTPQGVPPTISYLAKGGSLLVHNILRHFYI